MRGTPAHEPGRCPYRPSMPCPPEEWPGTRERIVLRLLAAGLSNAEIGKRMGFEGSTVNRWVQQLADRAGVPGAEVARPGVGSTGWRRVRLAVWAAQNGFADGDETPG